MAWCLFHSAPLQINSTKIQPLPLYAHQDTKHDRDESRKHQGDEGYCDSRHWKVPFRQGNLYTKVPNKTYKWALMSVSRDQRRVQEDGALDRGIMYKKHVPIASTTRPMITVTAPNGLAYFCIRGLAPVIRFGDGFVVEKPDIVNSWTRA